MQDFYREFIRDLGGNWIALAARAKSSRGFGSLADAINDIGDIIGRKLALEVELNPSRIFDNEASKAIGRHVMGPISKGKGLLGLMTAYSNLYVPKLRDDLPERDYAETLYARLSTSSLLPRHLTNLPATELIKALGMNLPYIIDPEEGLMVDKSHFFTVRIKDIQFPGLMSTDGPYIKAETPIHDLDGVALGGVTVICQSNDEGTTGWFVCKYGANEPRIFLRDFSYDEVSQLSDAFGIKVRGQRASENREFSFFKSPAWAALKEWVMRHPNFAARYAECEEYISGWYSRALVENKRSVVYH
jgi:hypothetical protein